MPLLPSWYTKIRSVDRPQTTSRGFRKTLTPTAESMPYEDEGKDNRVQLFCHLDPGEESPHSGRALPRTGVRPVRLILRARTP